MLFEPPGVAQAKTAHLIAVREQFDTRDPRAVDGDSFSSRFWRVGGLFLVHNRGNALTVVVPHHATPSTLTLGAVLGRREDAHGGRRPALRTRRTRLIHAVTSLLSGAISPIGHFCKTRSLRRLVRRRLGRECGTDHTSHTERSSARVRRKGFWRKLEPALGLEPRTC